MMTSYRCSVDCTLQDGSFNKWRLVFCAASCGHIVATANTNAMLRRTKAGNLNLNPAGRRRKSTVRREPILFSMENPYIRNWLNCIPRDEHHEIVFTLSGN